MRLHPFPVNFGFAFLQITLVCSWPLKAQAVVSIGRTALRPAQEGLLHGIEMKLKSLLLSVID